jgi:signal-transduction protein with cAMP-binding, CBS, and nucleotidyltransferase domain
MTRPVIDARVGDIMSRNLVVMPLASSAADIARKMTSQRVGSILAIDHEGKPIGIVTERDIVRQACSQNLPLESIPAALLMSSPLVSAQTSDTLEMAVELMVKYGTRHLVVKDRKAGVVGILSVVDLMKYVGKQLSSSDRNSSSLFSLLSSLHPE